MSIRRLIVYAVLLILGLSLIMSGLLILSRPRPLPEDVTADRIIVEKSSRKLKLMKNGKTLKTYRIALGSNPIGHKQQQGDERTPEGVYVIDYRNPYSKFHLSLHVSYPNNNDRQRAWERGVSPGGDIMIHGGSADRGMFSHWIRPDDWTLGCIGVSNTEIEEIWRVVPDGTEIEIRP